MVTNEVEGGDPSGLVDEQELLGDADVAPSGEPTTGWLIPSQLNKTVFPASAYIDLGEEKHVASVWIYDTNSNGGLHISSGTPGEWKIETTYDCKAYKKWVEVPLTAKTRYVRLTRVTPGAIFAEIAINAVSPEEYATAAAKKEAEEKAATDKATAIAVAEKEVANRPVVDVEMFGKLTLVDEIDVATADPGHLFANDPESSTEVQQILGKPARVLKKTPGEAAYMAFRVGQHKLLKAGATYMLEVEYPEDQPRSMVVLNTGNESALGFATGAALGDAFKPKYVNNNIESISTPLSGTYKTWTMLFNLHDRFTNTAYVRGETGERDLSPEDGFSVIIAQYSAENLPISHGAAVSRIRLYEVPDREKLNATYKLPQGLPQRHLFWREEMADGVVSNEKGGQPTGLRDPIDWYRYKANQMQFLGMNTYTKDLLEFGAVQHWDSSPHGGNEWAYFDGKSSDRWSKIVKLMGERGFSIMPYYEYAGSKGKQGLGPQRRAKPLTRDDAYTHIKWIESANADITDPEAISDFKKMLDITIVREKDKAKFVGAWVRPRSQLPIGFGDPTRERFAKEANGGKQVSRDELKNDKTLLDKYYKWWFSKRRDFLVEMRDYLRENGIDDATVLYTACAAEPGVSFATWDPYLVADDVEGWKKLLANTGNEKDATINVITPQEVVDRKMYLEALVAPPKNWGDWEIYHANPAADPLMYKETDGVLMTQAFNRLYTVMDPATFELFRGPAGLAIERHYSLNENMMFSKTAKSKLGYFAADIERNGPYCMMGEAMAMANGDPRYISYLVGRNFVRGFPQYVRNFNTAFLSLPALPSERLENAASDNAVVVRSIATPKNGRYFAIINTAMTDKNKVTVKLPQGKVTDAATGEVVQADNGAVTLTLYPFQMRALHVH